MAQILLHSISKQFNAGILFKDLNLSLTDNEVYAITGRNGAGKSTLLQIISGFVSPDKGFVNHLIKEKEVPKEQLGTHLNICGPYTNLFLSLTLKEAAEFHFTHKAFSGISNLKAFYDIIELETHVHKPLKSFSSGMLQKVKLGLALYSQSTFLLLDEPTSNFDAHNKQWFATHLEKVKANRLVVIASNEPEEIKLTSKQITLT